MTGTALIARLQKRCHGCAADLSPCVICEAADRIAALTEQMKMQEQIQANFFREAMDRAERAEADLAAAQKALRYARKCLTISYNQHGVKMSEIMDGAWLESIDAAIAGAERK